MKYFHRQYVSNLSTASHVEDIRKQINHNESENDHFLGIVAQFRSVFVSLEESKITMNMCTQSDIDNIVEHQWDFWKAHLDDGARRKQHHLIQKILIINFLAGVNFERLTKVSAGGPYIHSCRGRDVELYTIEEMIDHIESEHYIPTLTLNPHLIEPSDKLRKSLESVHLLLLPALKIIDLANAEDVQRKVSEGWPFPQRM